MKEETRILIMYRLERARESLEEAGIFLERGHGNTFVNRLYYACFYAVSAVLLTKGVSSAGHSGIRSLFHQNFARLLNTAFFSMPVAISHELRAMSCFQNGN